MAEIDPRDPLSFLDTSGLARASEVMQVEMAAMFKQLEAMATKLADQRDAAIKERDQERATSMRRLARCVELEAELGAVKAELDDAYRAMGGHA